MAKSQVLRWIVISFLSFVVFSCAPDATKVPLQIDQTGKTRKHSEIVIKAYSILAKNYYPPISPHILLMGAVRRIEREVGEIGLLTQMGTPPPIILPTSRKRIGPTMSYEEGKKALLEILEYTADRYPSVPNITIARSAIGGMVDTLDRSSAFLAPNEYNALFGMKKQWCGIGTELTMRQNRLTIVSSFEGTPAHRAGIASGDHIVRIDGMETTNLRMHDAILKLRGECGTRVILSIMREGTQTPRDYWIERATMPPQSVASRLLGAGYGYVRIPYFESTTFAQAQKAIGEFDSLNGIVLDLRDNPGGVLNQAVKAAELFITGGLIFSLKSRAPISMQKGSSFSYYSRGVDGKQRNYPIVVLINQGSANAAELLAGALKDHSRALVMGTRSFGKGCIYEVVSLPDGSALKYRARLYATPSGHVFNGVGIMPHVIVQRPSSILDNNSAKFASGSIGEDTNSGIKPGAPIRLTLPSDGTDMIDLALEILTQSPSGELEDMLTAARQMSADIQVRLTGGKDVLIHKKRANLEILKIETIPSMVQRGEEFKLAVNCAVRDPSEGSGRLLIRLLFNILRSESVVLATEPADLWAPNGKVFSRTLTFTATKVPGRYDLEAVLQYKGKKVHKRTSLEIK